jgi:glucose-6-phosphate 1-dehydrogenase
VTVSADVDPLRTIRTSIPARQDRLPARADRTIAGIPKPDDHVLVIFGATGDLARRKLLPGLWHLAESGMLPDGYRIVGASRDDLSSDGFRDFARRAVEEFGALEPAEGDWDAFAERMSYVPGDFGPGASDALARVVAKAEADLGGARRLFFLSVPPVAFGPIVRGLDEAGLAAGARVLMEKPFGTDLASARELNALVHSVFDEQQVFRIDHFLGKEGIQNILALRFANGMFEPVWNRDHIDHIQIDVPETLTVAQRVGFYDATGAFRDMVVTHLLQLLGFLAMEPPTSIDADAIMDEKLKVFRSLRPLDPGEVVRGQYEGYLEHDGVPPGSDTETLVALTAHIDNWRWDGVPILMRTGKRMGAGRKLVTIAFREPPRPLFPFADDTTRRSRHDQLTFDFDERGGITVSFLAKKPGPVTELERATMRFGYESLGTGILEAYERLFHDAMIGDKTLFTRADGIERLWEVATPLLDAAPPVQPYPQGGWGPEPAIHDLIAPRRWALP